MKSRKRANGSEIKEKEKLIQVDQELIRGHVDRVVRESVEETLNGMLQAEAEHLVGAKRYERTGQRQTTRAGHYSRKLQTKAGEVELKVPKLRSMPFETAIIERYRRRESSVEEALMEMYLAGVSVRRVEDITQALWGTRVSATAVSDLNKKLYVKIEEWRNSPLRPDYPYVFLDGVWLKRSWGGEVQNVAVLVAIGVNPFGDREVLGVVEGGKEDKEGWLGFLRHLKSRGLKSIRCATSDKCLGLVESLGETFPEAKWQRCTVHFYRNVFKEVPKGKVRAVAAMLKAIHAQEDRPSARKKGKDVAEKLQAMKLSKASKKVLEGLDETLTYYDFPLEHWRKIRTNNPLERLMREIRRRTRVVGNFPDGKSALMLVAARLRYIAGTRWGTKRYMNMDRLRDLDQELKLAS